MFRQKQNICRIKNRGSAPLIRIRHRFQTKLKTWVRFQIGVDFSSAIFVVFRFCYVLRFAKSVLTFIVKSTRGDMAL